MATEVIPIETKALSMQTSSAALAELKNQRQLLSQFIKSELKEGVDFGTIPGCPKPSLHKPGSEKLAKLFQLGSRILSKDREVDGESGFAMYTYTIEIFHIPTGSAIAQCEGSANSQEKKYMKLRWQDAVNTLQKMAQKRAYVGAVIIATGASDFFTQDVEDMPQEAFQRPAQAVQSPAGKPANPFVGSGAFCEVCNTELIQSKSGAGYYCKNFKDSSQGEHTRIKSADLNAFRSSQEMNKQEDVPF